jgi:hypothetical protein
MGFLVKQFYVYTINDPATGKPFYVGKGKGERCHQHVRLVKIGRAQANKAKVDRIRQILDRGSEPTIVIVERYEDQADAFAHEIELISALDGLTNVMAGGQGAALSRQEAQRRLKAREAKKAMRILKAYLATWEKWPDATFPNMRNGQAAAQEYVQLVRDLVRAAV